MKMQPITILAVSIFTALIFTAGNIEKFDLIKKGVITLCGQDKAGATSTLPEGAKSPKKYQPDNMFDGDLKTAWAEGSSGPGINVQIVFDIPAVGYSAALKNGAKQMNIINGYAASKDLFLANNRIKDFVLELYVGVDIGENENYCSRYALEKYSTEKYQLKDTMDKQSIKLDIDYASTHDYWKRARDGVRAKGESVFEGEYGRYLFAVIIIKSVYKGSKYNDTCISEISFE